MLPCQISLLDKDNDIYIRHVGSHLWIILSKLQNLLLDFGWNLYNNSYILVELLQGSRNILAYFRLFYPLELVLGGFVFIAGFHRE